MGYSVFIQILIRISRIYKTHKNIQIMLRIKEEQKGYWNKFELRGRRSLYMESYIYIVDQFTSSMKSKHLLFRTPKLWQYIDRVWG